VRKCSWLARRSWAPSPPMNIVQATAAYESWLRQRIPLVEADLGLKHERMAEGAFPFLRATFYRWAQLWPEVCPRAATSPCVLGVGDLHVENFGTWRDQEGRLVWGVNDFDEACLLPYANDLVRLAVSAQLAIAANELSCPSEGACAAILEGYREGMEKGGLPLVLANHHAWLRDAATSRLRDPVRYWDKMSRWPVVGKGVPVAAKQALRRAMPEPGVSFRIVHRQAGLGSLGRRRFTALAQWCGGLIAREAKELRVSAWHWERAAARDGPLFYERIIRQAIRVPDPFVGVQGNWLIRRLAPDCSRIELFSLPKMQDELKLFEAMGWETANIHLGTKGAKAQVIADLRRRPAKWLRKATEAMAEATLADWKEWRKGKGSMLKLKAEV
jgi:hypothetical protein